MFSVRVLKGSGEDGFFLRLRVALCGNVGWIMVSEIGLKDRLYFGFYYFRSPGGISSLLIDDGSRLTVCVECELHIVKYRWVHLNNLILGIIILLK